MPKSKSHVVLQDSTILRILLKYMQQFIITITIHSPPKLQAVYVYIAPFSLLVSEWHSENRLNILIIIGPKVSNDFIPFMYRL